MRFTDTKVFTDLLAPLDAEGFELLAQIDQLAGTIERKKAANAVATKKKDMQLFRADEIRLEAAQRKLVRLRAEKIALQTGGSLKHYQICRARAEMNGTFWSPEAEASLVLPRAQHEGWGEKAVRIMRGLPSAVTQEKRDMEDGDVKKIDNGHGGLQTVQVGRCGTAAVHRFIWSLTDQEKASLDPSLQRAILEGELPKELLEGGGMPAWLLARLAEFVLPGEILSQYGDIYAAFEFGYVVIPQVDADEAWTLVSITKGKPRYALRKAYSLRKLTDAG